MRLTRGSPLLRLGACNIAQVLVAVLALLIGTAASNLYLARRQRFLARFYRQVFPNFLDLVRRPTEKRLSWQCLRADRLTRSEDDFQMFRMSGAFAATDDVQNVSHN
jgi:hypothetical protein